MRVLCACEASGRVRDSFLRRGHEAISVDLLPTESPGPHYQGDIFEFLQKESPQSFDLMIAHPECTYITNAGARWFYHPDDTHKPENLRRAHPQYPDRWANHYEAVIFFKRLWELPIPKICIENPIPSSRLTRVVGKYSQCVHPHWFGDPFTKSTCLWLKGLPPLRRTHYIDKKYIKAECHEMSPGPERSKNRSRTYMSVAQQMSSQWG